MTIQKFLTFFFMFAVMAQPLAYFGQTQATGDWEKIRNLTKGASIRVETKSGKKIDGDLDSVSDTNITLLRNKKAETIEKVDVKKIYSQRDEFSSTNVGIGAAIGAGVGVGIGLGVLGATGGSDNTSKVLAPFIAIGAGVGAALGAALKGKKRTLIFESK